MESNKFKKKQIAYYRKKWSNKKAWYVEPTKTIDFYSKFTTDKVISMSSFAFKGKTALVVAGGGMGTEVKKMLDLGCGVTVADISPEALKEIKKKYPTVKSIVADAEKLPFKNNSFDFVIVKDGLHHLLNPFRGVKEIFRVCREGFFILDFQETFLTKFLKIIRFSPTVEEAGNSNHHLPRRDWEMILTNLGVENYKTQTRIGHMSFFQAKIFNNPIVFHLSRFVLFLFNLLFHRWGNILLIAVKK